MADNRKTRIPAKDVPEEQVEFDDLDAKGQANDRQTHETRTDSRGHESRVDALSEEHATHQDSAPTPWVRPSSLEAPPPRDGFVQRWIRMTVRGAEDPRNVSLKTREGWRPRPVDTIAEEYAFMGSKAGMNEGRFIVDDLMLCEMPRVTYAQRQAHYARETAMQMNAVEQDLEDVQVPGQPIVRSHNTSVTHPSRVVGRRAEVAGDD